MESIRIEPTERTPEIVFDYEKKTFSIKKESYPEDVTEFYGDLIKAFNGWLEKQRESEIVFNFEMIYFNSSTAKVLIDLFDILDIAANHNTVTINWIFDAEDDNMEELGEEFGEDLTKATFKMVPKT